MRSSVVLPEPDGPKSTATGALIERNPQFRLHFEASRQPLAALANQLIGHTAQMRRCSAYVSASTVKETHSRNSDVADAAP